MIYLYQSNRGGNDMKYQEYMDILKQRMVDCFDVEQDKAVGDYVFPLVATYHVENINYFLSVEIEIYGADNNIVHCVVKDHNPTIDSVSQLIEILKEERSNLIPQSKNHMSSSLCLLIVTEQAVDEGLRRFVEKFKYRWSSFLGIKGWVDFGVSIFQLSDGKWITNKESKTHEKFFIIN